ncbi:MAG TPA: helix-turn-helix domain-containing protein [Gammaproteobacteria bacterium]
MNQRSETEELEVRLRAAGHVVTVSGLTDVDGAAAALGVTARTLRRWRTSGTGPPHVEIGARIWYPVESLSRWLDRSGHWRS